MDCDISHDLDSQHKNCVEYIIGDIGHRRGMEPFEGVNG